MSQKIRTNFFGVLVKRCMVFLIYSLLPLGGSGKTAKALRRKGAAKYF
jgi:hypothetical protein